MNVDSVWGNLWWTRLSVTLWWTRLSLTLWWTRLSLTLVYPNTSVFCPEKCAIFIDDFHWRVVEKCHAAELSAPGTLITVRIALHAAVVACSVHVNMVTLSMHWFNVGTLSFEVIFIPSWFNRRSFYFYIFLSYIAVAMHEFEGMFNGENSMLENLSAARTQKLLYSAAVSLHQIDCIDRVTLSTTGSVI